MLVFLFGAARLAATRLFFLLVHVLDAVLGKQDVGDPFGR